MSNAYGEYLRDHIENVGKGLDWLEVNLPDILKDVNIISLRDQIKLDHDRSKYTIAEYGPYDAYFYGKNKSYKVVQDFNYAWLHHIHRNPHHWQYWVLINDDPGRGTTVLEMPYNYIIEMICDWWSFSWKSGELYEIFSWYRDHKSYIQLHEKTRKTVEDILDKMRERLDEIEIGEKYGV